jgi:hypothetical protein
MPINDEYEIIRELRRLAEKGIVENVILIDETRQHLVGTLSLNGRWRASVKYKGKTQHIGMFNTEDEAHEAYKKAYKVLHKEEWLPSTLDNKLAKLEKLVEKHLEGNSKNNGI